MDDRKADLLLICRVQVRLCALPRTHVVETLRALPVVHGMPREVPS